MEILAFFVVIGLIGWGINTLLDAQPGQRDTMRWGPLNSQMLCPHCSERGSVRTLRVKRKKGISGGKATGALLTGGISMLATGLSRKENATQAHCMNCGNTWDF